MTDAFNKRKRKQQISRRLIIVAVMTALAIVGRFIPLLKPVTAIVILTAVYLGPGEGFLCGAMVAFLSNFYFGQGPWTPFQMLSLGLIGVISGSLSGVLKKNKYLLLVFGGLSGILYSFVMDVWSTLWVTGSWDLKTYGGLLLTAVPFTISYAAANVLFLWLLAKPIGEKLERIKLKYGI